MSAALRQLENKAFPEADCSKNRQQYERVKNLPTTSLLWHTTDRAICDLWLRRRSFDSPLSSVWSRLPARVCFELQAVELRITEVFCTGWAGRPASLLPQAEDKSMWKSWYNLLFWFLVVIMARDKGCSVQDTVKLIHALQIPRS